MKRLTEHFGSYIAVEGTKSLYTGKERKTSPLSNCIVRLAAYEDLFERLGLDITDPAQVEELTALVKARDEGRVVVLDMPRKPLIWGDDDHNSCLCPDCGKDLMGTPYGERIILQCPECGQYLDATKIIIRAEAEAALGGGGNGS